jgi:hypothetical protein
MNQYIDSELIKIFSNIMTLPVLNIKSQDRDYLDYIKPDELTCPIMKGLDMFQRNFITLKLLCIMNDKSFHITITLFQRYTKNECWVCASNPTGYQTLFWNSDVILYDKLQQLIYDGKITENHSLTDNLVTYVLTK